METRLTNIHELEERFNLPASWFKREALAGRIPCLRVGRRLLFNLFAVEKSLAERAAQERQIPREAAHA